MKKLIFLLAILALAACSDSPVGPVSPAENGEDENDTTVVERRGNPTDTSSSVVISHPNQKTDSTDEHGAHYWYIVPGENLEVSVRFALVNKNGLRVEMTNNSEYHYLGLSYHLECGEETILHNSTVCPSDPTSCDLVITGTSSIDPIEKYRQYLIEWEGEYRVPLEYVGCGVM